jgi:putative ABC transport system ATP-binding protein
MIGLVCSGLDFAWQDKTLTDPWVLKGVEAHFPAGKISLVTGKTGAGKSTLLHLLAGLLRPARGEIRADGEAVSRWPSPHRDRWRQLVGIVFQNLAILPDLTVGENLLLPLIPRRVPWSQMQSDIYNELNAVGLADLCHSPAEALSGGERQRAALARALVGRPRFILADEPTSFQDDHQTLRMIHRLADEADRGAVVVVCSHDPRFRESSRVGPRFYLSDKTLTEQPNKGNGS